MGKTGIRQRSGMMAKNNDVLAELGAKPQRAHKVLVLWKENRILRVSLGNGRHETFLQGYNTIDDSDLEAFYKENKALIKSGRLVAQGVTFTEGEDGAVSIKDDAFLVRASGKTLRDVVGKTFNPKTLEDLSNPDVVSAHNTLMAIQRSKELSDGAVPDVPIDADEDLAPLGE